MFLKQKSKALCKKIGKVSLASLLSAAMLMSGTGSIVKASTEGSYVYKNNTAKMVASVESTTRGYGHIYYPVKTELTVKVQLYYMDTNGKMCLGNSNTVTGTTTQVGTSFSLSAQWKNSGYKVQKVRSTGTVSGATFVNSKTGKSYVEDLR